MKKMMEIQKKLVEIIFLIKFNCKLEIKKI